MPVAALKANAIVDKDLQLVSVALSLHQHTLHTILHLHTMNIHHSVSQQLLGIHGKTQSQCRSSVCLVMLVGVLATLLQSYLHQQA